MRHAETNARLPEGAELAYDGLVLGETEKNKRPSSGKRREVGRGVAVTEGRSIFAYSTMPNALLHVK